MLEKKKRRNDYYSISSIIDDAKQNAYNIADRENPTAEEVLTYMIGNQDHWTGGEYVVYQYNKVKPRSFIQRLNMLWVFPLFFVSIPFQYLFLGDWGVNRNSKIGKAINWLVKLG